MAFAIHLKRSAEKELDNFPSDIYKKVICRIISLKDNPRPRGVKKLTGKNWYRLRVGDYRILYTINSEHKRIDIYSVAHRKEVYRWTWKVVASQRLKFNLYRVSHKWGLSHFS